MNDTALEEIEYCMPIIEMRVITKAFDNPTLDLRRRHGFRSMAQAKVGTVFKVIRQCSMIKGKPETKRQIQDDILIQGEYIRSLVFDKKGEKQIPNPVYELIVANSEARPNNILAIFMEAGMDKMFAPDFADIAVKYGFLTPSQVKQILVILLGER